MQDNVESIRESFVQPMLHGKAALLNPPLFQQAFYSSRGMH
jgi:hypothetical protein